jgi:hypothetical protein
MRALILKKKFCNIDHRKSRNRSNVQTMMGQFFLYLTDTVYVVFLVVAFIWSSSFEPETKDLVAILKNVDFGLLSVVHYLLIPELRTKVAHKIDELKMKYL